MAEACFLCDGAASDQHHIEFRSRRPELREEPSNLLPACRNCHDRIHSHELELTQEGGYIIIANPGAGFRVAVATNPILAGAIFSARPAEIASAYALDSQERAKAKLRQWRFASRLRAWARVMQPERWDIEAARILGLSPATLRAHVMAWDHLFPEMDMSVPQGWTGDLERRMERLIDLPGPVLENLGRMKDALEFLPLAEQQVAETGGQYLGEQFRRDAKREKGEPIESKKVWVKAECPACGHEWHGEAIQCRYGTTEPI